MDMEIGLRALRLVLLTIRGRPVGREGIGIAWE